MRPRLLLAACLSLLLALLTAPPGTAHSGAPPVKDPKYAGYLFACFTGEGTADGEQIRYALRGCRRGWRGPWRERRPCPWE